jgi:hypothetical protein
MPKRSKTQSHKPKCTLNLSLSADSIERVKLHALVKRVSVSRLIEDLINQQLTGISIHRRTCAREGQGGQESDESTD